MISMAWEGEEGGVGRRPLTSRHPLWIAGGVLYPHLATCPHYNTCKVTCAAAKTTARAQRPGSCHLQQVGEEHKVQVVAVLAWIRWEGNQVWVEGWPWTLRSVDGPLGSTATLPPRGTGISPLPYSLIYKRM